MDNGQNNNYGQQNGQYGYQQNGQYGYQQPGYDPNHGFSTDDFRFNPYRANIYSNPPFPAEGRFDILTHVLLLIFTFGIWELIWNYRTTKYLNCCPGEEYRNPTTKLLLCMFVPFYHLYWVYKSSQRIDKMSALRGVPSDSATINLILEIFVGIVPPILMQSKINDLTK